MEENFYKCEADSNGVCKQHNDGFTKGHFDYENHKLCDWVAWMFDVCSNDCECRND